MSRKATIALRVLRFALAFAFGWTVGPHLKFGPLQAGLLAALALLFVLEIFVLPEQPSLAGGKS